MNLEAVKLTLIKRIFYVFPKESLLFLYFKILKNHRHAQFIFSKLFCDVAYVLKYHDKDRTPPENQQNAESWGQQSPWWKKDFYIQRPFHKKCIEGYMERLTGQVRELQPHSIVDVGCANGGRIDMLAAKFPEIEFVGIDFVAEEAKAHNQFKNARYIAAYPLDGLKQLSQADMIFSTQSLIHALPNELHAYIREFERLGVKYISIMDSNINGYLSKNDGKIWSKHQGYTTGWCHNYSGYLKHYGYEVTFFKDTLADFHPSRSDYHLVEILGCKPSAQPAVLKKEQPQLQEVYNFLPADPPLLGRNPK